MKKHLIAGATLLSVVTANAQKIDFNLPGRNPSEVTSQGFTPWAFRSGTSATKTFGNVTITIEPIDEGGSIRCIWSKRDVFYHLMKTAGDGAVSEGGIKLIISGLTPGVHTIQAFHNSMTGNKNPVPLAIFVNGIRYGDTYQQSADVEYFHLAKASYVTVLAEEGKNITLEYRADTSKGNYENNNVFVNSIAFDLPDLKKQAMAPQPFNREIHASTDKDSLVLSFAPGEGAVKHHLYFGTDYNNLKEVAVLTEPRYTAKNLSNLNMYYWRVDEEDVQGIITRGMDWQFRPRHFAFPGAEGYGKYATGGRGGSVYHVTNLEDNGDDHNPIPGSFRYGITKVKGPRTIVFDVSGIISLKKRLTCSDPFVTIAGQTAPGNGITLTTSPFGIASEGITRFIRMRLGHKALVNDVIPSRKNGETYGDLKDSSPEYIIDGIDGMGMAGNDNAIMDHCSISWTIDEGFSSRNSKSLTLQRTLISEALNEAGHPNYKAGTQHGYAATIGGGEVSKNLAVGSYHHNLLAHCEGRNWSISGGLDPLGYYDGHHDIFNNVVYNWGKRATDGGSKEINFVNNFYKMGPATTQPVIFKLELEGAGKGEQRAYVAGNVRQNYPEKTFREEKEGTTYQYKLKNGQTIERSPFVQEPFFKSHAAIQTARAAYKNVLSDVGANVYLDPHDARMIKETLEGTYSVTGNRSNKKGLPDSEENEGCEGFDGLNIVEEKRPANWDTDGDGMPDWWEKATGHTDGNLDEDGDGYTNLEEYLNWMAEPHFMNTKDEVDLTKLFAGYNNKPTFTIMNVRGQASAKLVNGNKLKVITNKKTKPFVTVKIRAVDQDNWGFMERTLNFYAR